MALLWHHVWLTLTELEQPDIFRESGRESVGREKNKRECVGRERVGGESVKREREWERGCGEKKEWKRGCGERKRVEERVWVEIIEECVGRECLCEEGE